MTGQYAKCSCHGCSNDLNDFDQIMAGICYKHMQLLEDDDYFAGICWECCTVTFIGNRYRAVKREGTYKRFKELVIKDKYIFSKGCEKCTGNVNSNVDWMTINSTSLPTTWIGGRKEMPATFISNNIKQHQ